MANTDDTLSVTLSATLRNGEEIALRQIALGLNPMVLIEPSITDDDGLHFDIDATSFDSKEQLAELLESVAQVLREGASTHE